jgi:hypothetical protein
MFDNPKARLFTMETCVWAQDDDGIWLTDCENAFTLNDGAPSENDMKFCCYCGKPLKEEPWGE